MLRAPWPREVRSPKPLPPVSGSWAKRHRPQQSRAPAQEGPPCETSRGVNAVRGAFVTRAGPIIPRGAIAQLAERRTRIAEVESSSLFRSTTPSISTARSDMSGRPGVGQDGARRRDGGEASVFVTHQTPAFFMAHSMLRPTDE